MSNFVDQGGKCVALGVGARKRARGVEQRFHAAKVLADRGEREDDKDLEVFRVRIKEFREKTLPVLQHYKTLGLLVEVNGDQPREAVFNEIVEKLYRRASQSQA